SCLSGRTQAAAHPRRRRRARRGRLPKDSAEMKMFTWAVMALALALLPRGAAAQTPTETLTDRTFGRVAIYAPSGEPKSVVLFVSGDGGWSLGVVSMAGQLRDLGALVVGIDIRSFLHWLSWSETCAYPAGELEDLSRNVQLHR